MKLSEMRALLRERNLRLTRSLGQNFLHDANQLRRIVALAELAPGDAVLEIGPGLGPLTERLLAADCRVLAIEQDARLVAWLRERWPAEPRLTLEQADAVAWLRAHPRDWSEWRLVANLPYSVASVLLVDFALAPDPPARLVVTVQREVARRLTAAPATPDYGLLTLLVGARYQPAGRFAVPANCFFPPPKVASTCLRLDRRPEPLLPPALLPEYRALVKCAFGQRRKKMLKLLKQRWPEERLRAALAALDLSPDLRAEKVRPEQFARLTELLAAPDSAPSATRAHDSSAS